uniref:triacylglycerol lipase n=1 Tax=[Candida] hispaniensis TaxID=312227 RepID=A0A078BRQ9_9ASCO|nr:lipase [[Candida] hispaniensis]
MLIWLPLVLCVSQKLLAELTRYMRFAEVAGCVGSGSRGQKLPGITRPFQCPLCDLPVFGSAELLGTFSSAYFEKQPTGYIAVDTYHGELLVVFRGTTSFGDKIADFSIFKKRVCEVEALQEHLDMIDDNAQIFGGVVDVFNGGFEPLIWQIKRALMKYPGYRLVVLGHSLGGAIATLCAVTLKLRGFNPYLITFAEHLTGNWEWAQTVNWLFPGKTSYRVTRVGDIVPRLPPTELGYYPRGSEYYISSYEMPLHHEELFYCDESNHCSQRAPLWSYLLNYQETQKSHFNYFFELRKCTA